LRTQPTVRTMYREMYSKLKAKSINMHTRFIYCNFCIKSYKTSACMYQTTRFHSPKHRNLNVIHTCFGGISNNNVSRSNGHNSGRPASVPNCWNPLYNFWAVTNKTTLRVYQMPCHFFRPTSFSTRRTITKLPYNTIPIVSPRRLKLQTVTL